MKQNNFFRIAIFLLTAFLSTKTNSQSAGDIAFIALNADGNDEFAWVALADIPANTPIWFTDNEWDGDSFNNINEGEVQWSHTSILPAGSVVVIAGNTGGTATIVSGLGTLSGTGLDLGASNETLYALLSQPIITTMSSPGFLAGISSDETGSAGSLTGTGLTLGTNFLDFANDRDGFLYTGSRSSEIAFSDYLPLIMDIINWQQEASDGTLILPISNTAFTTLPAGILSLGTATTSCTTISGPVLNDDTYSVTIPYTIILDGKTFILTTTAGNISGDSPTNVANGTITISNIPEGTSITFTASDIADGGPNNISREITTPVCFPLVINEALFDPNTADISGDANGDGGVGSATQDEFIEFVNTSNVALDISGYTISDGTELRHVFPSGTIVPAGGTIVVFGGGTPTGIPGLVQTASNTGQLNLNNAGDNIILKNPSDVEIINFNSVTTGLNFGSDQSGARNPDITGDFVLHNAIAGNPVAFSPGRLNADNVPIMKTWSGSTNNDWATATNWISNSSPSITDNVVIPAGLTNYPTATSAVTVNSVLINSGASLIAQDAFTASITYNRNLPTTDNWYLVSSPVSGESIEDLISNFTFASGTGANIGFSTFNNTGAAWTYASAASTGNIVNGKGYSVRLATPGNIGFTGTANTSDVTFALTQGTNNFNLVGNPFTASINSTTFLTNETANMELTFWMWNGTSYDTRTTGTHPNFKIAPGQAFFVEAKTTNNVTFTEALQSHETTDTFQKNSNTRPELKLTLSDGTQSRKLEVFYIEGTTKGFDNGFDGKMFGGVAENFSLYSELLAENVGVKYAVQSLPNSDFENMVVPVGIKAAAGKEITFSAEAMNLPDGINVYLEDRTANTVTLLSEANATYKVTLTESLDGIGRFYLHTKASGVLSTPDVTLNNISIYSPAKSTLRIAGVSQGKASVKIYSVLGKQVFANTYNTTGVIDMNLPTLTTGLYVVQLETEKGTLNKKITLE